MLDDLAIGLVEDAVSDEFFRKIDEKLATEKTALDNKLASDASTKTFIERLIPRLLPLADKYRAHLASKGINVQLKSNQTAISFDLKYGNGDDRSLSLGLDYKTGKLDIKDYFTDEDGKRYSSTSGRLYDEHNWNDSIFESALQKTIEDFLFYADRHGGTGASS